MLTACQLCWGRTSMSTIRVKGCLWSWREFALKWQIFSLGIPQIGTKPALDFKVVSHSLVPHDKRSSSVTFLWCLLCRTIWIFPALFLGRSSTAAPIERSRARSGSDDRQSKFARWLFERNENCVTAWYRWRSSIWWIRFTRHPQFGRTHYTHTTWRQ